MVQDPEAGLSADDWSADGLVLILRYTDAAEDFWVYSIEDDEMRPYVESPFHERAGDIAPGGRYAAYVSNETGRYEVYVQTFPEAGERWTRASARWRESAGRCWP